MVLGRRIYRHLGLLEIRFSSYEWREKEALVVEMVGLG